MSHLSPLLKPVAAQGRVEEVVRQMAEAIHLGLLDDGERLPVEVELARQFNVAPMTMREALASLRDEGLIETRRGRTGGSFVRRPQNLRTDVIREQLAALPMSALRDLCDEQRAVTGEAAALAATRASQVNLRRMRRFTEQLRRAQTPAELVRADSRFHIELAIAAQSERLTRLSISLQSEFAGMLWFSCDSAAARERHADDHTAIIDAIAVGDPVAARDAADRHVVDASRLVIGASLELRRSGRPRPRSAASQAKTTRLAAAAADVLEPIYAHLERLRTALEEHFTQIGEAVAPEEVPAARELIAEFIATEPLVYGSGFVAEVGAIRGEERQLHWWNRHGDGIAPLQLNLQLDSLDSYDYTEMEWFTRARTGSSRVAFGPYVDYAGSDLYTITTSVPVMLNGRFVGVAGADVDYQLLEERLVDVLLDADHQAVVLTPAWRVIASNSPRFMVGDRLRAAAHDRSEAPEGFKYSAEFPYGTGWFVSMATDST